MKKKHARILNENSIHFSPLGIYNQSSHHYGQYRVLKIPQYYKQLKNHTKNSIKINAAKYAIQDTYLPIH